MSVEGDPPCAALAGGEGGTGGEEEGGADEGGGKTGEGGRGDGGGKGGGAGGDVGATLGTGSDDVTAPLPVRLAGLHDVASVRSATGDRRAKLNPSSPSRAWRDRSSPLARAT